MKKTLLMSIVSGGVFGAGKAQTSHVEFGVKGGVNMADIHVSNGADFSSKVGFYAGGLAHIHLTPHFAVQPELSYSLQGGEMGSLHRNLGYINLPVLAQYMTGEGFRLQTGPQLGFLAGANDKDGNVEVKIKDQLNNVDFGWAFGASYLTHSGFGLDG